MSPDERQLRAALHQGEGESVDVGAVVARAEAVRHGRRVRLASVAAAVVLVGAVGTGGAILFGGSNAADTSAARTAGGSADSAAGPAVPAIGTAGPGGSGPGSSASPAPGVPAPGPLADAARVPCPSRPPHYLLPGGGGSGQFGAGASLFSGPVESVKVCGYAEAGSATVSSPLSRVVTGQRASELTASLDAASTIRPAIMCPVPADWTTTLVVIGLSHSGAAMKPVVVPLTCGAQITNGSAVRYGWQPPADLAPLLPLDTSPGNGLSPGPTGPTSVPATGPASVPPTSPSGKVGGSPVR